MRGIAAGLTMVMTVGTLACGEENVDSEQAEQEIKQQLSSSTAEITSVSCPSDAKKEEGRTFTCDAELEAGGKAQVTATQTDNRGSARYQFKPGTVQLADNTVEPVIEESLAARGIPDVQVDCPALIPVAEGESSTCQATGAGGRSGEITYTWSSDDGSIDDSSIEAPAA
jgi:hypothetical protein